MSFERAIIIAIALSVAPTFSFGEEKPTAENMCKSEQAAVTGIQDKYKPTFDGYQKEGDDLKKDAVTFNFDVSWADTEIVFDTPSVNIKDQKLIFGVPQVTMKLNEIVFHTPSIRMKRVKTGQYPEFFCEDTWISLPFGGKTKGVPKCTVRWSDTFADVPEPFQQEQRVKLHIPEFKFADTQIIMGVPEFFMQRQRWVLGLPQFKLTSVVINPQPLKDKSEDLQNRVAGTKAALVKETGGAMNALYACYRNQMTAQRKEAESQFNVSLAQMDGVIQSVRSQGADPTKLTSADGVVTNLVAKRDELFAQRNRALSTFDDALNQLDASEKAAISKLQS